jgi:hypothetical protein
MRSSSLHPCKRVVFDFRLTLYMRISNFAFYHTFIGFSHIVNFFLYLFIVVIVHSFALSRAQTIEIKVIKILSLDGGMEGRRVFLLLWNLTDG